MRFGGRIEELAGDLPSLRYVWDENTEILSGKVEEELGTRGYTGSVELEDSRGAVITLDMQLGAFQGLEVVVWPTTTIVEGLEAPPPNREGYITVPARPSQPGIAVLEIDVPIDSRRTPDGSLVHLRIGELASKERVQVADNLMVELNRFEEIAGFWLLNVPPLRAG